jgi:DEAD/DEAH box helicase domain-containing protein
MTLIEIIRDVGLNISDETEIAGRVPQFVPVPTELHPDVSAYLRGKHSNGLYKHQGVAIVESLKGRDICLSTSTASGKSLVFMALAADLLKRESHARVVAFYPVKALIQDQLEKWKSILEPLGFSVGFIDGSVDVKRRPEILLHNRAVLMTPDVGHSWFMSSLSTERVRLVRDNLGLIILDEAHVYDGVFGTNMAFFLRRFQAVCRPARMICSTATLGHPTDFILQLTGRDTLDVGPDDDGSAAPTKNIAVLRIDAAQSFDACVKIIKSLAQQYEGRFLAFADSRKMVELITSAAHRATREMTEESLETLADETANRVVPYRAGYENADRERIQRCLSRGELIGVISTSALELGLDIGDITLVVLLTTPPSMKAFWQRVGRAGRRGRGEALVIDTVGAITSIEGGLASYLNTPLEPNWLYLQNRFLQYTNALCAAQEKQDAGPLYRRDPFVSLPPSFANLIEEEINPTQMLPSDLFSLKQRASATGPHYEFALRSGVEKSFKVLSQQQPLGELSYSQLLREAYPGAVYYYMARPYRVISLNQAAGEVLVRPEQQYTTKPNRLVMVFPDLGNGSYDLKVCENGFVSHAELQVSERVLGFKEKRGQNETNHLYDNRSSFSQRPLLRFIRTTGVCWHFKDDVTMADTVAEQILQAFCRLYAVQSRDLGIGRFHTKQSPTGAGAVNGICIFDATHGSLRLTERLAENFVEVVKNAYWIADDDRSVSRQTVAGLKVILQDTLQLVSKPIRGISPVETGSAASDKQWRRAIARGEKALIVRDGTVGSEVTILNYFVTNDRLRYRVHHEDKNVQWTFEENELDPLPGATKFVRYNAETGEEELLGA